MRKIWVLLPFYRWANLEGTGEVGKKSADQRINEGYLPLPIHHPSHSLPQRTSYSWLRLELEDTNMKNLAASSVHLGVWRRGCAVREGLQRFPWLSVRESACMRVQGQLCG